jgi:hypothetical protein
MTPNELYALPHISADYWYNQYTEVAVEVLQLKGISYDTRALERHDTDQLVVHDKLHHNIDGNRGVSVYALFFEQRPFALLFTGGRGGRDSRTPVVTDATTWSQARKYAMAVMTADEVPTGGITARDEELTDHYYGSQIARFNGEVRLVAEHDVNPLTKSPVYDRKKFDETFDAVIRPLGNEIGYEDGLSDPRMMQEALNVFRSGVLGDKIDADIDLGDGNRIVAVSVLEGQTFAHVADTRGKYYSWARRGVLPRMVGPASMLECYRDLLAGREITTGNAYVLEASEAFGADPSDVLEEVVDFLRNGGTSMAERIILRMPRDERVPVELTLDPEVFTLGFMVVANPDLLRFCTDGYPDLEEAQKVVDKAGELARKIAAGELKAPTVPV